MRYRFNLKITKSNCSKCEHRSLKGKKYFCNGYGFNYIGYPYQVIGGTCYFTIHEDKTHFILAYLQKIQRKFVNEKKS